MSYDLIKGLFSIMVIGLIAIIGIFVFIDCRKHNWSFLTFLFWEFFAAFCFPPFGLIYYIFYKKEHGF
ncbi:hypothetical protein ciss_13500 [Carboxydothermus islandicus]|uniref:Uncharacterized protein n=1 Tax=Carboxydothermus islandicus TaxID=661089 RepID=A0A1L8D2T5_9THEO|nr:hypothetical protein ciss_13500 [Carboxydothermus islandicus]